MPLKTKFYGLSNQFPWTREYNHILAWSFHKIFIEEKIGLKIIAFTVTFIDIYIYLSIYLYLYLYIYIYIYIYMYYIYIYIYIHMSIYERKKLLRSVLSSLLNYMLKAKIYVMFRYLPLWIYLWWHQRYLSDFGHVTFIIFINLCTVYPITTYKDLLNQHLNKKHRTSIKQI